MSESGAVRYLIHAMGIIYDTGILIHNFKYSGDDLVHLLSLPDKYGGEVDGTLYISVNCN